MKNTDIGGSLRAVAWFLLGCGVLAFVTWISLQLDINLATACLLYTIIVVLLSMTGNIAPAIALAVIASGCLNYFFTEPRFTFAINAPEDLAAIIAFVLTAVVITTLVRRARRLGAEAALKGQLQLIIDTIPAVVWSNFPDGSAEFLNQRFRDYSGLTAETGQGSAWMSILHPEDRTAEDWHAALASGEPFEKEARLRSAEGAYRRFLLRFVPLRDRSGAIVKWYATSTDIEDLKRAEEELRQREAYLREAQAELAHVNRVTTAGQLAASIAHEVAQPVAASVTNANAALRWLDAEPPDMGEARQALGRIVRDGRRASDILARIRALVRKAPSRRDRIDINATIGEVLALTRAELRRNRIAARTRFADGLPPVEGDRVQLQQVMLNLILNAIEAMSGSGDESRDLLITTEEDEANGVRISVCDSGPGLPPETLARLFEAFYTTKSSGMGMGLSICRSIVEAHGGRVRASANEPRGAVFQFTLPREAETVA
ncbi:MAG TPA: ATP-binding protein [Stellaceae bacterium]|jgi:PAS domain S-box-containing protein|nr:ATP-binding protein [Stellaceae bacterium]